MVRRGILKFLYCFLFLPLYPLALGSDSVEISIRRNDGTVSCEINKKRPNTEHWIPMPPPTPPQLTTQLHTSTADCSTPFHSPLPIVTKERTGKHQRLCQKVMSSILGDYRTLRTLFRNSAGDRYIL